METTDTPTYLTWESGMEIDADGAPNAYGPPSHPGLDYLANAGSPGDYYGIVTTEADGKGDPVVQGPNDPCPGMYVSTTALVDHTKGQNDPHRYVDSTKVPYLSIPSNTVHDNNEHVGNVGFAYDRATSLMCEAIVADVGPRNKYGEGSIALGTSMSFKNVSPKNGGVESGVVFVIFKNSNKGWPRAQADVKAQVDELIAAAGGLGKFI